MSGEELKLLPCPFCGAFPDVHDSNMGWQYVICPECNGAAGDHANRDAAVKAWNTRHPFPEQPQEGVRERIAEALYGFRPAIGYRNEGRKVLNYAVPWSEAHGMHRQDAYEEADAVIAALRSPPSTETKESGE